MELAGQNVLVLGLGLSGRSAARFCAERGARVVAADERPRDAIEGIDTLESGIELSLGRPFPALESFDLVVPSPGVPAARWRGRARRAWGDIELCARSLAVPVVAVTGTNGKSTVVRLIEAMARAAGLRARAAGNLGVPALELVGEPLDLAILEVSSFQLESIDSFRPRVAVLLNVSPDHLDRHRDLDGYVAAKRRLFANQRAGDTAVLNEDDPIVRETELPGGVERLGFSRRGPVAAGAWLDGRKISLRRGRSQHALSLDGFSLRGPHNEENAMAALLAVVALDADVEHAARGLVGFRGLPHRCEVVAELGGVTWIDDSKATNVGAAIRSLGGIDRPVVWIAGGRHKGGTLEALPAAAHTRVRRALLIGESAPQLATALEGSVVTEQAGTLAVAVERAHALAEPGDVVLLAPACASFDQFEDFEDRGRRFQALVRALGSDLHPRRSPARRRSE